MVDEAVSVVLRCRVSPDMAKEIKRIAKEDERTVSAIVYRALRIGLPRLKSGVSIP
mgnify:CR=1 FL=1|jgi:hypothetical protein